MMRSWTWCRGHAITERVGKRRRDGLSGRCHLAADILVVRPDTVRVRPQVPALNR